jgi:hypothetical protein
MGVLNSLITVLSEQSEQWFLSALHIFSNCLVVANVLNAVHRWLSELCVHKSWRALDGVLNSAYLKDLW